MINSMWSPMLDPSTCRFPKWRLTPFIIQNLARKNYINGTSIEENGLEKKEREREREREKGLQEGSNRLPITHPILIICSLSRLPVATVRFKIWQLILANPRRVAWQQLASFVGSIKSQKLTMVTARAPNHVDDGHTPVTFEEQSLASSTTSAQVWIDWM